MNITAMTDMATVLKQSVCLPVCLSVCSSRRFVCLGRWHDDFRTSMSPQQSSKLYILQSVINSNQQLKADRVTQYVQLIGKY